jgi:RNase P/RNase MRP subunit POP5
VLIARRKSRYLLVESSKDVNFAFNEEQKGLAEGIAKVIGEFGYMNASPKIMKQLNSRAFVIRSSRGSEGHVVLALSLIKQLNGREIGFYTLRESGSIRKLEEVAKKLYGQHGSGTDMH